MKWFWNPNHYWPIWFGGLVLGAFGLREFWALGTGRPQDTFSWWVWRALKIHVGEHISQWNATDYLFAGIYLVVFSWLFYHFFLREFA